MTQLLDLIRPVLDGIRHLPVGKRLSARIAQMEAPAYDFRTDIPNYLAHSLSGTPTDGASLTSSLDTGAGSPGPPPPPRGARPKDVTSPAPTQASSPPPHLNDINEKLEDLLQ